MKKVGRKSISFILVLTFILSMLPFNAFAAETEIEPVAASYTPSFSNTGIYAVETSAVAEKGDNHLWISINDDNAYCIEPKTALNSGSTSIPKKSDAWTALGDMKQEAINTALTFGYEGNKANIRKALGASASSTSYDAHIYVATQVIIWEITQNQRSPYYPYSLNSGKSGYISTFCRNKKNPKVQAAYNAILKEMSTFQTAPSFTSKWKSDAPTITLTATKDGGTWSYETKTLNDSNKVLSQFSFAGEYNTGNAIVSITQKNNTITLSIKSINENGTPKEVSLSPQKSKSSIPNIDSGAKLIEYGAGRDQDTITGYEPAALDPPNAYINLSVEFKENHRDGKIRKELYTAEEYGDISVEWGQGAFQNTGLAEGWYYYVEAPTNNYTDFNNFILGPTNTEGYTQSIREYIAQNIDSTVKYDVPQGNYTIYELGKLKEGKSGNDLVNDYYFPDNISPIVLSKTNNVNNYAVVPYGNTTSAKTHLNISEDVTNDYLFSAENEIKIPFKLKKVIYESEFESTKGYFFTITNNETGESHILRSGTNSNNGYAYIYGTSSSKTNIYLPEGTYTVHELGKAKSRAVEGSLNPDDYTFPMNMEIPVDYEITISIQEYLKAIAEGKDAIELEFVNTYSFPLAVYKKDKDTKEPIANVEFGIYADPECQNLKETIKTDENGYACTVNSYVTGTYYAKELNNPDASYKPNSITYVIICKPGAQSNTGVVFINVSNEKYEANIKFIKKDNESDELLEGAVFEVYKSREDAVNSKNLIERLPATNKNGEAVSTKTYRPGTYYYKEIVAPYGYQLSDSIYIITVDEVFEDGTVISKTQYNDVILSKAGLKKIDNKGNPLEGAKFNLYSDISLEEKYLVEKDLVSNSEGLVVTNYKHEPGTYYFVEKQAPDGYEFSNEGYPVTIGLTNDTNKIFMASSEAVNISNGSYLEIVKKDSYYGNKLDVTIGVYRNSICTDIVEEIEVKNGYGKSTTKLPPGTYYLKETLTEFGYQLNKSVIIVNIPKVNVIDNVVSVDVNNIPNTQTLSIEKTNSNNGALLEGATFELRKPYDNLIDNYVLSKGFNSNAWVKGSDTSTSYVATISNTIGINGKNGAMELDVSKSAKNKSAYIYQDVYPGVYSDSLAAGQKYVFSAKIRIGEIGTIYDSHNYGAKLKAIFYYTDGSNSGVISESEFLDFKTNVNVNNGFSERNIELTIPENLSYIRLILSYDNATGKVYFDDVKFNSVEFTNWTKQNASDATISFAPNEGLEGSDAIKIVHNSTTATSVQFSHLINTYDIEPSTSYTLSAYIRVDSLSTINTSSTGSIKLSAFFLNTNGVPMSSIGTNSVSKITSKNMNNGYVYISADIISPNETSLAKCRNLQITLSLTNANGTFYLCNPRFYKNNKLDDFNSYTSAAWGVNTSTNSNVTFTSEVSTDNYLNEVGNNKKSLKINVTEVTGNARGRSYYDVTNLEVGKTYILSGYIKTENLTPISGVSTYGAVVGGTIFYTSGSSANYYSEYITVNTDTTKNSGFQRVSVEVTIPENFSKLRVNLALKSATGSAYFDEIRLEPKEMIIKTVTTDNNGYATFGTINNGDYDVAEISAPKGYKLNTESRLVEIGLSDNNHETFLSFTNTPNDRTISLSKFNRRVASAYSGGETKYISGAVYELYFNPVAIPSFFRATVTTNDYGPELFVDANGQPFKVSSGTKYYLREKTAPYGFMLDPNWYVVTINDTDISITDYGTPEMVGGVYCSADSSPTYIDSIEARDPSYVGNVKITKKFEGDAIDGNPSYDQVAKVEVRRAESDEVMRFDYNYNWTGETYGGSNIITLRRNEQQVLGNLPPGDYYLTEVFTPKGYMPMGKIPFSIKMNEDGTAAIDAVIVIENYESVLSKTGGSGRFSITPIGMVATAIIFCSAGVIAVAHPRKFIRCKVSNKKKTYKIKS